MKIWKREFDLESLKASRENTMVDHLGIEITEVGDDYLVASMPVDNRTHQPMGILHGGASIALAETVGSMAANLVQRCRVNYLSFDLAIGAELSLQIQNNKITRGRTSRRTGEVEL